MTHSKVKDQRQSISLSSVLTVKLRDCILRGEFSPGEKLTERELCKDFGVSRSILREALQNLQAEKLLVRLKRKGSFVASVEMEETTNILAMRQVVEPYVVELFIRNASDEEKDRYEKVVNSLRSINNAPTGDMLLLAQRRLDALIMSGCGNAVAAEMLTLLKNRSITQIRMTLGTYENRTSVLREIEAIGEAIMAKKSQLAASRVLHHIASEQLRIIQKKTQSIEVKKHNKDRKKDSIKPLKEVAIQSEPPESSKYTASIDGLSVLDKLLNDLSLANSQKNSLDQGPFDTNNPSSPEMLYKNSFVSQLNRNAIEAYKGLEMLDDEDPDFKELTFAEILQRSQNNVDEAIDSSTDDIGLLSDYSKHNEPQSPTVPLETGKKRKFFSRTFLRKE